MACESRDLFHIRPLRVECEVPHLHVLDIRLRRELMETPLRDRIRCKQRLHTLAKELMGKTLNWEAI